jgi:hypothetical protein
MEIHNLITLKIQFQVLNNAQLVGILLLKYLFNRKLVNVQL